MQINSSKSLKSSSSEGLGAIKSVRRTCVLSNRCVGVFWTSGGMQPPLSPPVVGLIWYLLLSTASSPVH